MDELKVVRINREVFSLQVRMHAVEKNDTLLDSILHIANQNRLELEVVPRLLTKDLKELLEVEAANANLIEKNTNDVTFADEIEIPSDS